MADATTVLFVRIDTELFGILKRIAEKSGIPLAHVAEIALAESLGMATRYEKAAKAFTNARAEATGKPAAHVPPF